MIQKNIWAGLAVSISMSIATGLSPLAAAPATIAEIATYAGADRQSVLEAGAKREGTVLIYATGTQADPLYEAFAKKYPFIKVESFKGDSPTVTRRVIEEYAANTYLVDTLDLAVAGLRPMMEAGLLQPYRSPEQSKFVPTAIEPKGHWTIDYESYVGLGYNTKLISEAEAPKTYEDLLDPKWRGKMAVPGSSTLGNWIGAMIMDRGEPFVRRFAEQKIRVYEVSARAVANLVVSGEVPLSPALFNSHMANSQDQGAPVDWRPLGGVYATTGAMALAAKAPHPHAAMLFIDFILSQEGQSLYQKLGYASSRTDLPVKQAKPTKVYYFGDDPDYQEKYEKWIAIGRQIVGK
jgi:iron(III) transport system substrate-binding protein